MTHLNLPHLHLKFLAPPIYQIRQQYSHCLYKVLTTQRAQTHEHLLDLSSVLFDALLQGNVWEITSTISSPRHSWHHWTCMEFSKFCSTRNIFEVIGTLTWVKRMILLASPAFCSVVNIADRPSFRVVEPLARWLRKVLLGVLYLAAAAYINTIPLF